MNARHLRDGAETRAIQSVAVARGQIHGHRDDVLTLGGQAHLVVMRGAASVLPSPTGRQMESATARAATQAGESFASVWPSRCCRNTAPDAMGGPGRDFRKNTVLDPHWGVRQYILGWFLKTRR